MYFGVRVFFFCLLDHLPLCIGRNDRTPSALVLRTKATIRSRFNENFGLGHDSLAPSLAAIVAGQVVSDAGFCKRPAMAGKLFGFKDESALCPSLRGDGRQPAAPEALFFEGGLPVGIFDQRLGGGGFEHIGRKRYRTRLTAWQ
jgi:hypothetical protein